MPNATAPSPWSRLGTAEWRTRAFGHELGDAEMLDYLVHLSELLLEKVSQLQDRLDALSLDHTQPAVTAKRLLPRRHHDRRHPHNNRRSRPTRRVTCSVPGVRTLPRPASRCRDPSPVMALVGQQVAAPAASGTDA
jgi:hypothetical protein